MKQKHKIYCEPFLEGGAMFFYLSSFLNFEKYILSDISQDLIDIYLSVRDDLEIVLTLLDGYKEDFLSKNLEEKSNMFYEKRNDFNLKNYYSIAEKSAILIFLNKTCFNGLFRMNKKGQFNAPFGKYTKPSFYDKDNILRCSQALQKAEVLCCDFIEVEKYLKNDVFIYLDPPYKEISKTSSFNSYSGNNFKDAEQVRLANFIKNLSSKNYKILLSNSDPKNYDIKNNFFEELYQDFFINQVQVKRAINSKGDKRGKINELLISNYNDFYIKYD